MAQPESIDDAMEGANFGGLADEKDVDLNQLQSHMEAFADKIAEEIRAEICQCSEKATIRHFAIKCFRERFRKNWTGHKS